MANINDIYGGDFLTKDDLNGKTPTVTIAGTEISEFPDGDKITLLFERTDRKFTLNKTNALAVAEAANSFDTDDWVGTRIQLYVDPNVTFRGRRIGGIRIRKPSGSGNGKAQAQEGGDPQPAPNNDDDWLFDDEPEQIPW